MRPYIGVTLALIGQYRSRDIIRHFRFIKSRTIVTIINNSPLISGFQSNIEHNGQWIFIQMANGDNIIYSEFSCISILTTLTFSGKEEGILEKCWIRKE